MSNRKVLSLDYLQNLKEILNQQDVISTGEISQTYYHFLCRKTDDHQI